MYKNCSTWNRKRYIGDNSRCRHTCTSPGFVRGFLVSYVRNTSVKLLQYDCIAIAMQLHSYCNAIYLLLIIYLLIYLYSLFFLFDSFSFFSLDFFEIFSKNPLTTESERCTLKA